MTDLDLARQLIAAPWWRWEPGMLIADYGPGIRYCWQDATHLHGAAEEGSGWMRLSKSRIGSGNYLPDLTDAATAGVLLGWLTEAEPGLQVLGQIDEDEAHGWAIRVPLRWGSRLVGEGASLGEAVARALLAVGGRRG